MRYVHFLVFFTCLAYASAQTNQVSNSEISNSDFQKEREASAERVRKSLDENKELKEYVEKIRKNGVQKDGISNLAEQYSKSGDSSLLEKIFSPKNTNTQLKTGFLGIELRGTEQELDAIEPLLENGDTQVADMAFLALSEFPKFENRIFQTLKKILEKSESDDVVRDLQIKSGAIGALAKIHSPEASMYLQSRLVSCGSRDERMIIVNSLWLFNRSVYEELKKNADMPYLKNLKLRFPY